MEFLQGFGFWVLGLGSRAFGLRTHRAGCLKGFRGGWKAWSESRGYEFFWGVRVRALCLGATLNPKHSKS